MREGETAALRRMTWDDVSAGMRLAGTAGWNQTEHDWALFLRLHPEGCFVAADGERVVGTVTSLRYPGSVAWVSMLLVEPAYRGRGIGARLFDRAVASVRAWGTVALDATPAGQALYARRGFAELFRIDRMVIGEVPSLVDWHEPGVSRIEADDWPAIGRLDGPTFDADRTVVLRDLWARAPDMAWQRVREGRLVGVVLGRRGARYAQVGPVIAETAADAVALCRACLGGLRSGPAVLDVPAHQGTVRDWLTDHGFVRERTLQRMVLAPGAGAPVWAGDAERQYAIAGPELG